MNEEKSSQALAPVFIVPNDEQRVEIESDTLDLSEIFSDRTLRFIRRHGITMLVVVLLAAWTVTTCTIAAHNAAVDMEKRLAVEYEERIQAFYAEQAAAQEAEKERLHTAEAQMQREADAIARVIGTMNTKRMKGTMLWNILCRVDNPNYPGSVEAVIEQPSQWIFYSESNPIREDDRQFALEQLEIWHDGRYPAGLTSAFVYGEWSENDYVIRDTWDRNSRTNYWRFPE